MCRNIRPLNNFDPPATADEIHDAALQYVRKIAGSSKPSAANRSAYELATAMVADATQKLIDNLVSNQPSKNRATEAEIRRTKNKVRFANG